LHFGQMIVDRIGPQVRQAGYEFDGPLIVERWDRAPDGSWIAPLRVGETPEHLGQRYMILRGHTLYHLGLGPYYHSRETAVKEYAKALQR